MNDCGVLMMVDESDKSVVVWFHEKSLLVTAPNPLAWASLCLYHDEVVVCRFPPFNIECQFLETLLAQHEQFGFGIGVFDVAEPIDLAEIRRSIDFLHLLDRLSGAGIVQAVHSGSDGWREPLREVHKYAELLEYVRGLRDSQEDFMSFITAYLTSKQRGYPLASEYIPPSCLNQKTRTRTLSDVLARTAISQLALPAIQFADVDDLMEARTALRDELLEFRVGILDLTHLLHQQVKGENDLTQIRYEANVLVDTKIKAAVLSLEHRMQQHKNKRIHRMLFKAGRILVDFGKLFLPGGIQEKLLAGGKAALQTATELDSSKPTGDQVATYLYKLKRQLES
jgi:hypothetical protein